jgi:protein phosphatase 2C family protein 2/3
LISQGKELSEIGEIVCEHCLAPDTASGAGIGCDNMTMMVVGILGGRTKEQWYNWITERVKEGYGHKTPDTLPPLYALSRLTAFRARRQAEEAREKERQERQSSGNMLMGSSSVFGPGITRILGGNGGISFHPGGSILSDNGALMFDNEDGYEEDSDDDMVFEGRGSFFNFAKTDPDSPQLTKSLKEQLDELDKDAKGEEAKQGSDTDSSSQVNGTSSHEDGMTSEHTELSTRLLASPKKRTEETPPPPQLPNGVTQEARPSQLESLPAGDEPISVVSAEGLLDHSENPVEG